MIRLKAMPSVPEDFIKGMVYCAVERLKFFKQYPLELYKPTAQDMKYYPDITQNWQYRKSVQDMASRAGAIKYLLPIARQEETAMDLLVSRLRKLNYETYVFKKKSPLNKSEFICTTNPLTMVNINHKSETWEIGKYVVTIPVEGILNASLGSFMMRPLEADYPDPTKVWIGFHPHHTSSSTCWSEWSYPITEACRTCNFDVLFGIFIRFLEHFNSHSPLAQPPHHDDSMAQPDPINDPSEYGGHISPRNHCMYWMKPYRDNKLIERSRYD
jgi:hypothetical protein